jgi:histidine decarboxylase
LNSDQTYHTQLEAFLHKIKLRSKNYIGYPAGVDFDYEELTAFLKFNLNNVGDPFAELFKAPVHNWWGYVTNGGSEGNLYALYIARELYPNGMVYYSEATHYSVQKNIHLLGMSSIVVRADEKGEIDYDDLRDMIQMHRHRPVIILANIGTTMTEAKDDVSKMKAILKSYAIKSSYIHSDAALSGIYLALLNEGKFNFADGADSIAISGHKFIGMPVPSGAVLVKKSYKDRIGRSIPYINSIDTTISGSRNGITPLYLWYAIKKYGKEGLLKRAQICLQLATYVEAELNKINIKAWRNQSSLTVVFPRPSSKLCAKWQLASENDLSHLICMPGVTKQQVDEFVLDYLEDIKNPQKCNVETGQYILN